MNNQITTARLLYPLSLSAFPADSLSSVVVNSAAKKSHFHSGVTPFQWRRPGDPFLSLVTPPCIVPRLVLLIIC